MMDGRRYLLRLVTLCFLLVLSASRAGGQERNMSLLTQSDTTYADVSMGFRGETGRLKDIYSPEAEIRGVLEATSRRKLGRVSLYGHFGYGYAYGRGSTWRGWIDPYETPFMLADSIPGAISLENYTMEAGLGLPLAGGWSAGLDLAYDVVLMAKHRDLRNKNTGMTFRVAPGISWQGGRFGFGLDAGYERSTERVEYMQVSESVEQVLFDLYGLWLYHGSGFSSAEPRRMKEGNRFFGDLQFSFRTASLSLENQLHLDWQESSQTEVGYNNLRFGDVRSLIWGDDLSLEIGDRHRLEIQGLFSSMQGFRPLQRQELDPDSRIRVWVTYGGPVFCYWRQYHAERTRYRFGERWKLAVGVENWGVVQSYTEYPRRFVQRISTLTPTLALEIPAGRFVLVPTLGYAYDYGTYNDVTEWQLAEPLLRQWDYWDGSNYLGSFDLRWSSASGHTYVHAYYGIEASTAADADGMRHTAALTLGFIF